jgi:hypothetical protein
MGGIAQKIPFAQSMSKYTADKIAAAQALEGQALPCSVVSVTGAIVVVKFEVKSSFTLPQVTMPLFGPEYIRYPIQRGDKGFAIPADARLGAMSGLGGGVATLDQPNNLAALTFLPIGNKNWTAVDPQSVTIYGPNGVVMRDTGSNSIVTLTPTGIVVVSPDNISFTTGETSVTITPSSLSLLCAGASLFMSEGNLSLLGNVYINSRLFLTHEHSAVMTGSDNSGGVV